MAIHQRAFRGSTIESAPFANAATQAQAASNTRASFVEQGDLWIAPEEAKSSNFVEIEATLLDSSDAQGTASPLLEQPLPVVDVGGPDAVLNDLPLGSWIEMMTNQHWVRTQLTWASPHGTLFLFTTSMGATQSMTRRSRDRLIAAGQFRMISGQPIVEVALDAVAQVAMRNSVDTIS